MDSQEWAEQFPTVSVKIAKTILEAHGWDDVAEGVDNALVCSFDEEGYEIIAMLDENGEVDSQQLVNWLGY